MTVPVHLIKGNDDVLRGDALTTLLDELVGSEDRSLVVDEFNLDVTTLGSAIDAAQTPPFLTAHRVVVVRRFGRFSKADEIGGLLTYLQDPLPTSRLVLVWEKPVGPTDTGEPAAKAAKIPPTLTKAVTAAGGEVVAADAPSGKGAVGWVADQLAAAGLDVDPRTRQLIIDRMGEDTGAVVGLVERLRGAHGTGARLTADDVEPFLGTAGGVPPWELTDAVDSGDVPLALEKLHRMLEGGDRHPLAIMATLQSHYTRMVRLDGAGARTEKDAAAVLGLKGSTFPAKKALSQSRRLGPAGTRRAVALLAGADVDLRGARAWPGELVMEVLVARLTRLSRSR